MLSQAGGTLNVCGIICNPECGKPGKTSSRFLNRNGLGGKLSNVFSSNSEIRRETGSIMMTAHHSHMDIVGCFFIVFIVLFGGLALSFGLSSDWRLPRLSLQSVEVVCVTTLGILWTHNVWVPRLRGTICGASHLLFILIMMFWM